MQSLTRLIERSPLLLVELDSDLNCLSLSNAWRERLPLENRTAIKLSLSDLLDDESGELAKGLRSLVGENHSIHDFPVNVMGPRNPMAGFLSAWTFSENEKGPVSLMVSVSFDVECGETLGELVHIKSLYRLILDAAGEGVYGLDRDGRGTFLNQAAMDILGWRPEDVVGAVVHDIHHHSHFDGAPYPREKCPIYSALKDGEVHRVESEVFWHLNGSAVPVEYTSTPIWKNGEIDGAVIVFRDISQRKQAEEVRDKAFAEIKDLKEQLELERDYLRDEINVSINFGDIVGESPALKRTLSQVESVAATTASVLILGESGVGKEMIARAIHANSDRAEKALVKVNCASIPRDLFESEFFGHIRGSFTGAHRDRVGRLQLANGGTLFLDEVGEIPLDQQSKLLRALQEQQFERVGDDKTIFSDVRIVAATNRDLKAEVSAGRFREDLFYRLSVFPLELPPLRERRSDIVPLAHYFLRCASKDFGRSELRLTRHHAEYLEQHDWPGNIRELKNVIERAVILSKEKSLRLDLALPELITHRDTSAAVVKSTDVMTDVAIRELEKANMIAALNQTGWRIAGPDGAADLLGLKPSTFTYRMNIFGIKK